MAKRYKLKQINPYEKRFSSNRRKDSGRSSEDESSSELKNQKGVSYNTKVLQRVVSRFGGARVPNQLTIEIDKAKTLRRIDKTLQGILDVMRYTVSTPVLHLRFA